MSSTTDELAAIVGTGEYSNAHEEAYFLETLVERQQKSGRFGLLGVNPLDAFRVKNNRLELNNLAEKHGFVDRTTAYRISWSVYDNVRDSARALTTPTHFADASAPLPAVGTAPR